MMQRAFIVTITLLLPVAFLFFFNVLIGPTHAATLDVCAACSYTTIQDALDNANAGDIINIGGETFTENLTIVVSVTLQGAGSNSTIIDGGGVDRVITVTEDISVTITGVTIQNGDTSDVTRANGGGLYNDGSVVIIDGCLIRFNHADINDGGGGGISNQGVMTITNSTLYSNTAEFGGGLSNGNLLNNMPRLALVNVQIDDNHAEGDALSAGGGVENHGIMTMDGVMISNNHAGETGGGIEMAGGTADIANSTLSGNTAELGGGLFNGSTVTVTNTSIYNNIANGSGGGIDNVFTIYVTHSQIYGNEAPNGAGINTAGTLTLTHSAVYDNNATGQGGGIRNSSPPVGNSELTIKNSTISGNETFGPGGGLYNDGATATAVLNNVTIYGNMAVAAGGGLYVNSGAVQPRNSIISHSQISDDCGGSGLIDSQGYNLAGDDSCNLSGTGDFNAIDPMLGPLQDNGGDTLTHAVLAGSLAIDTGHDCETTDQRGVTRPIGDECDRGAYETAARTYYLHVPNVIK